MRELMEVCVKRVVTVRKSASVFEAARKMRDGHVGNVVVVDEVEDAHIPIGILTDRDIVIELIAKEISPDSVCVGELMSDDLVTLRFDKTLEDAEKLMRDSGVRRLPIVDGRGRLVGIVAADDILRTERGKANAFGELFREQRNWERVSRP